MIGTLIKLGFVALFVGAIAFLLALGLFGVAAATGAIALGIPLGTALIQLGIPIATAFAFVAGCGGALADVVLNITGWLSSAGINRRRSELELAVANGQINVQEALLRHYQIVYDETAQIGILPSVFKKSSPAEGKSVWETRKFICEYVLPLMLDKYPPYDSTSSETWIEYWDKFIQRLVGCHHRVLGKSSFLSRHIHFKLNPQKLALRIEEEYNRQWGSGGAPAAHQRLLDSGGNSGAIPADTYLPQKEDTKVKRDK
jgi:hypothetical protein